MSFTTTSANTTAVSFKGCNLNAFPVAFQIVIPLAWMLLLVGLVILIVLRFISLMIFFGVITLCSSIFVRHKSTASNQLAALTRQAGKRQLEVIIP